MLQSNYPSVMNVNVDKTGRAGAIKDGVLQCTQIPIAGEIRKQQHFLTI